MPSVEELLNKSSKKKFVKQSYRPWDHDTFYKKTEQKNDVLLPQQETVSQLPSVPETTKIANITRTIDSTVHNNFELKNHEFTSSKVIRKQILTLVGIQQSIFLTIFSRCLHDKTLITSFFSASHFEMTSKASLDSVKTSLKRLIKKGLIKRYRGKRARNGYLCLGFEKQVWDICVSEINSDFIMQDIDKENMSQD